MTAAADDYAELAMNEERLKEIRERHRRQLMPVGDKLTPTPWCMHCDDEWPCDTIELLDYITELQPKAAFVDDAEAVL